MDDFGKWMKTTRKMQGINQRTVKDDKHKSGYYLQLRTRQI